MNTDGNTDAINRHLDEREEHDAWQEGRDAIDALADAEERIEELEAQLREIALDANAALGQAADAYEAQLAAEAAIPRAYQMGLDAAADRDMFLNTHDRMRAAGESKEMGARWHAEAIRALTPPADLVEQCKKETSHD